MGQQSEAGAAFAGGGEAGELLRGLDWSATTLGRVATWPVALRAVVGSILNLQHPMVVLWGPEYVQIYNDGYRDILQGRHPRAMGQPGRETWKDEWPQLEPLHEAVLLRGEPVRLDDTLFLLTRRGFIEETYFTLCYSPIPDLDGDRAGILVSLAETTAQVLAARRLATLRRLAEDAFAARTPREAGRLALEALATNSEDIPFALLFAGDAGGPPSLVASHGRVVTSDDPLVALVSAASASGPTMIDLPGASRGRAMVLPLGDGGQEERAGILVLGVSERLHLDVAYDGFLRSVAGHLASALANARAHRDALAARTRLVDILESMGDAFHVIDRSWNIVEVNASFEAFVRRPRSVLLGRNVWTLFPEARDPSTRYWAEYHRCMEDRVPAHFVEHFAPLAMWTEVQVYPTADGIAVFSRDVSVAKRADGLALGQASFERHLVGIVSHDLRNPLAAIHLGASMLASAARDEQTSKVAARVLSSTDRAIRLVRDLLDFTQARLGGGIPVQPAPIDLHGTIPAVVEEVRAGFPGRDVQLALAGNGRGLWDLDRISQVVANLLSNALRYSPKEEAVTVRIDGQGVDHVELSFHNGGPPIPAALLSTLFEPMQRAVTLGNAARSVGLGLYIVRSIVDAHGGSVEVGSDEASGTTFTIRLPRRPPPAPASIACARTP